ncbi:hypothetical protein HPB50_007352 [Hyalomma asiaticum]|uniref:Uncharacterized protein n=1 Tax=Hyalomma asiaticum TaxID=266040 RepID=A0ACB7SU93_HYAAI|nr:hypothetical protein HPB50_007352 [Hyalomma asiaticum]
MAKCSGGSLASLQRAKSNESVALLFWKRNRKWNSRSDKRGRSCDASGVPSVVTSRVGGDAALPCHLRHATQDSWAVSVSWYKRGLSGPVYTVDMGSGNFLQARHRPAHLWAGRAYFSSADEPALLMIGDVAAADAGLYVCSALFANGAQRNSTVRFVVVVPPETPVIRDKFGNKVGKVAGPYREGESLTLTSTVQNKTSSFTCELQPCGHFHQPPSAFRETVVVQKPSGKYLALLQQE